MCCKNEDVYGASLNCSDSHFPQSYEKLGTWGPRGFLISPCLSKPHVERVEKHGIINVSCSKGLAMIKFQLSTSRLEWVLYFLDLLFWEELMSQTQNLPLLPFFMPSINLPKWIVTLDKLHKLCSTISKLTNCPHGWKPTSDPKSQPTVGILPKDFFF